jgi:hypothetical protein
MRLRNIAPWVVCVAMLAFITTSVTAQVYTGRIEITVVDTTGAVLPGTLVEISGPQNATAPTDAKGMVQFLNLAPGTYQVVAKLSGFQDYTNTNVPVGVGVTVPLKVTLGVGTVAQDVFVTAESPVIDPKKMTTSTNITNEQLQEIPSARDPWVVLQTVPGIIVDRVNVGGAESGQQSGYQAKGSPGSNNTWNIDGIPITDMAALGSSPTYYDFDMFEEMQVTTGGADMQSATAGVGLNFVLKSGSNQPRGSARIYYEDEDMQANNLPDDLRGTLGGATGKGNRINLYKDYGGELGGPIWKDRLWGWGAYGKTDVTLLTLANTPDQTILDNRSLKLTGQATQNLRGSYTFFRGDKLKYGRNAGPLRPPETTVDQSGPTTLQKGEANFVIGSNLFVTGRAAHVDGGFQLTPQGGLDTPWYTDDAGIQRGSANHFETIRPQWTVSGDGNFFRGNHEVKFGFGWRRADVDSSTIIPGYEGLSGIASYHNGYPNMIADIWVANNQTSTTARYIHAYVGDTMTWDRLTLNLGVRWGRAAASGKASTQEGSRVFPQYLPDLVSAAQDNVFVFNAISPRIGATYALDEARRTIVRVGYASFADQMNATEGGYLSPIGVRGLYLYDVIDRNGNRVVDPAEVAGRTCSNTSTDCIPYGSFDINNPGAVESVNSVGDYDVPMTHEFQLGLDRELMPNFGVSGTFTYRTFVNFNWSNNGVIGTDYVLGPSLTGSHPAIGSYDAPIYIATRVPANRNANVFRSRDGYSQRFLGFELAATKRLSNRWMARFGFSTNDHREYFDSPAALTDPTPAPNGPDQDGGLVVRQSGGSGKSGIYQVLPKYQFILTGLYQAPWGINLAANMVNRQGFSKQYFRDQVVTTDPLSPLKSVFLLDEAGQERLPAVTSLDFRIGKEFTFGAGAFRPRINIDLDIFNLLNSATVLGRQYNLRVTSADNVLEIMNPRVLRVGLRIGF